ncbi:hypothetical protein, partial [uncultured Bifidobacterium sp.]|uniref:hypothetical protein n=1 Tax=uncultured Bifidobacterium sp. TaxID=165187 RepID=UPI0026052D82
GSFAVPGSGHACSWLHFLSVWNEGDIRLEKQHAAPSASSPRTFFHHSGYRDKMQPSGKKLPFIQDLPCFLIHY